MSGRFLADACALVDFLLEPVGSMTAAGNAAMAGDVLVSAITVWELTRKSSLGELPRLPTVGGQLAACLASKGFQSLPLTWADTERANALPPLHMGPDWTGCWSRRR